MADRTNRRTKELFREWLEKLQQESWQLELLISGLALFGIWESRALLGHFEDFLDLYATGLLSNYLNNLSYFLKVSWVIFFVNLLVHIIVRGLWIGAIGLRYVSGDIDYDDLGYSERFDKFLRRRVGDFDDYIERLEKLASIIFSFTFLLMFLFMSIIALFISFGAIVQIGEFIYGDMDQPPAPVIGFILVYFLLCLLVFIDFISFGSLKKIESPIFSKFYFWTYRIVGVLTLSFLYRPLLYNFIDDRYTKRLVIIAIPYIMFISFIFPSFGFDSYNYDPSFSNAATYENEISINSFKYIYYDDLREQYAIRELTDGRKPIINWVSLDAYEYNDQSLAKVFFRSSRNEDRIFEKKFPHLPPFTEKGLHFIFNSNDRDNETIDSLRNEEAYALRYMRKILRGEEDKITAAETQKFGNKLTYYQKFNEDDYDTLKDEVHEEYVDTRVEYYQDYLNEMINAKKSLIDMSIDSHKMTDSLDCSFFVHPNMGERGILCYFPISSYANGKHEVDIRIEQVFKNSDETFFIEKKFPFVINRKIN